MLVCVLKGAIFFMADLARRLDFDLEMEFMAVSSYGASTESSGVVRILKDLDTDIEGRHVLIVEDIIDSGLTLQYLTKSLWSRNPASVEIVTLLSKPSRRTAELPCRYTGFEIAERVRGRLRARLRGEAPQSAVHRSARRPRVRPGVVVSLTLMQRIVERS